MKQDIADGVPSSAEPAAQPGADDARGRREITPEAARALAEAAQRREAQAAQEARLSAAREIEGRGGRDPVRYNDWEVKGLASDF